MNWRDFFPGKWERRGFVVSASVCDSARFHPTITSEADTPPGCVFLRLVEDVLLERSTPLLGAIERLRSELARGASRVLKREKWGACSFIQGEFVRILRGRLDKSLYILIEEATSSDERHAMVLVHGMGEDTVLVDVPFGLYEDPDTLEVFNTNVSPRDVVIKLKWGRLNLSARNRYGLSAPERRQR